MIELLSYGFVYRGAIAGCAVAVICALLGVVLVLRRLSLIGDGLAHVTFFGVAVGLFTGWMPVFTAIPVVMASSLGILKLMRRARMYGDAAIGMLSAAGVAGGVMLASLGGGLNVDIFNYLFGNILAVSGAEMWLAVFLSALVIAVMIRYRRELLSVSFDEEFATVSGINTEFINTVIVLLSSLAVVLAIKIVGVLLTSALIVIPAVTAIQLARGFNATLIVAAFVAGFSVVAGLGVSLYADLPGGASIVLCNFVLFLFSLPASRLFRSR